MVVNRAHDLVSGVRPRDCKNLRVRLLHHVSLRTKATGEYTLTGSRGGTGVCPGNFKVVVSKLVLPDGGEIPEKSTKSPMELKASETLPPHYSQPEKTILTASVPADGGTIDFPLKTKGR